MFLARIPVVLCPQHLVQSALLILDVFIGGGVIPIGMSVLIFNGFAANNVKCLFTCIFTIIYLIC